MPRGKKRTEKLQPVAVHPKDRVYLRTEAARLDKLPADIVAEGLAAYRKAKSKAAETTGEGGAA